MLRYQQQFAGEATRSGYFMPKAKNPPDHSGGFPELVSRSDD
jgi:hypothetical protein